MKWVKIDYFEVHQQKTYQKLKKTMKTATTKQQPNNQGNKLVQVFQDFSDFQIPFQNMQQVSQGKKKFTFAKLVCSAAKYQHIQTPVVI